MDMSLRFEAARVGLRNKETGELIAVYPETVTGDKNEVQKKVFDWYYKTSCSAETEMRKCFVDDLTSQELKSSEIQ